MKGAKHYTFQTRSARNPASMALQHGMRSKALQYRTSISHIVWWQSSKIFIGIALLGLGEKVNGRLWGQFHVHNQKSVHTGLRCHFIIPSPPKSLLEVVWQFGTTIDNLDSC